MQGENSFQQVVLSIEFITFRTAVTKHMTRNNIREGGFVVSHSLRGHIPSQLGRYGGRSRVGAVHTVYSGSRV